MSDTIVVNITPREIKFRAWLPSVKVMLEEVTPYHSGLIGIDADTLDELVQPNKVYDEHIEDSEGNILMPVMSGDDWYWIDTPHYHLMQYTVRKDKNGKEIYEGDIITYDLLEGLGEPAKTGLKRTVSITPLGAFGAWDTNIQVIGNIFEGIKES